MIRSYIYDNDERMGYSVNANDDDHLGCTRPTIVENIWLLTMITGYNLILILYDEDEPNKAR